MWQNGDEPIRDVRIYGDTQQFCVYCERSPETNFSFSVPVNILSIKIDIHIFLHIYSISILRLGVWGRERGDLSSEVKLSYTSEQRERPAEEYLDSDTKPSSLWLSRRGLFLPIQNTFQERRWKATHLVFESHIIFYSFTNSIPLHDSLVVVLVLLLLLLLLLLHVQ